MEPSKSTENLTSRSSSDSNKVLLVVVVIAIVVGAIALILAIVSLSQPIVVMRDDGDSGSRGDGDSGGGGDDDAQTGDRDGGSTGGSTGWVDAGGYGADGKIWQLSFEHTGSNYGYIDDATGEVRGFQIDLATTVCQIAGKNCQMVYDSPTRCWESQKGARPQGGDGLMGAYYDGCVGWVQSYDRPRTFKFTNAYSYPILTVFMIKVGTTGFNWKDLTGKTIGFIDGWAYDEHCIAREKDNIVGWDLELDQIMRYPGREELLEGLISGEVDAIFDNKAGWIAGESTIEIVSDDITSCARDGLSVMMRKDNQLDVWWNDAFGKLRQTSQWRTICNDLLDEHGHRGGPQPEDFCVGLN